MTPDEDPEPSWLLFERVVRSLAHSVGNTINVVSGRLSLLELDTSFSEESRNSVQLIRERLRRLHNELKGALAFSRFEPNDSGEDIASSLESLHEDGFEVSGLASCSGFRPASSEANISLRVPLLYLRDAHRRLSSRRNDSWFVEQVDVHGDPALALHVVLDAERVPAARRALLEPWFSEEAHALDPEVRYGRLLLAQALGLLEAGGASVAASTESRSGVEQSDETTRLQISWPAA